jgi:lysyl-tRNA synthetase class 1
MALMTPQHTPKGGWHWAEQLAERVLAAFPNRETYVGAAGISPSGEVHIGNFRDIATTGMVLKALQAKGHKVRFVFSWDDFDEFRKVPAGIPEHFSEFLGRPLCDVPDPEDQVESYALRNQKRFEGALEQLGIELEYRYQHQLYRAGTYDDAIIDCLRKRDAIGRIIAQFRTQGMRDEEIKAYYPITVYSQFSGKSNTEITHFDGESSIGYRCKDTGNEETIDIRETRIIKLPWKTDWAMRWKHEDVCFEPGGKDHHSQNGSFDTASAISRLIFEREPPVSTIYEFIGIRGGKGKMSGSSGNTVMPSDLLELYDPRLLLWLFSRYRPNQVFDFAFDSEIFRQYDEFDRELARIHSGSKKVTHPQERAVALAGELATHSDPIVSNPIPFRQAVSLGQIVQFQSDKMMHLLAGMGVTYDPENVERRMWYAQKWLCLNPEERIEILDEPNRAYVEEMSPERVSHIKTLSRLLEDDGCNGSRMSISALNDEVYGIPKLPEASMEENKPRQKQFFQDIYNLLIAADTGPRLSTFLWALDRRTVVRLLQAVT